MVVTPSLPVNSVAEFIDYAKAHPKQLSMASSGVGASPHLTGEYFKFMAKIDMVHVPYPGSAAAYPDLISGKVHVLFDNLEPPRSGAGTRRQIAGTRRDPHSPAMAFAAMSPAIAETVPGFEINVWYGIFAPRDTPADIARELISAVNGVLADPKIVPRFSEDGGTPLTLTRSELALFLTDDMAKWRKIAEFVGITPE